jgi:hypothetical protein
LTEVRCHRGNKMSQVVAKITLFSTENGGKSSPLRSPFYACPLEIDGSMYDCRILIDDDASPIFPGSTFVAKVKFLFPNEVLKKLRIGKKFRVWEAGFKGDGEVIEL